MSVSLPGECVPLTTVLLPGRSPIVCAGCYLPTFLLDFLLTLAPLAQLQGCLDSAVLHDHLSSGGWSTSTLRSLPGARPAPCQATDSQPLDFLGQRPAFMCMFSTLSSCLQSDLFPAGQQAFARPTRAKSSRDGAVESGAHAASSSCLSCGLPPGVGNEIPFSVTLGRL